MAGQVDGKRFGSLFLAASLGLNITLGGVLIYQSVSGNGWERDRSGRDFEGRDWRRSDWDSRSRSMPDSVRSYMRFEPEQLERMRELRREMSEEIVPLRDEIHALQDMIGDELRESEPDVARLDSMTARTANLQNRIQQRSLRLILKEREILSPEQYRALIRFMVPGGVLHPYDSGGRRYEGGRGSDRGRGDSRDSRPPPEHERPPGVQPQIHDHSPVPDHALV